MKKLIQALRLRNLGPAGSWRLFFLFLSLAFSAEAVVMVVLPVLVPTGAPRVLEVIVDALLLTVILAPLAWRIFLMPLLRLHEGRARLLDEVLSAQERERMRIVSDLHDGLGQNLTAMLMRLQVLEAQATDEQARANAAALRAIAVASLEEVRRVVRDTRPPVLDTLGLAAAVETRLLEVRDVSGIHTDFSSTLQPDDRLPVAIETAIYRVIQEAVTNAVRHASPSRIAVALETRPGLVQATVSDDGVGFDPAAHPSAGDGPCGTLGMQERVRPWGGVVEIRSRRGAGTTVAVRIPLDA